MTLPDFTPFPKIYRYFREIVITEKIDGTNAVIHVAEDGVVTAGSRNRWITPTADNFGFAYWVEAFADDLRKLGPGQHHGEWWGPGIQRGYGLTTKRFSLFNTTRWGAHNPETPACCSVVPVLYQGDDWGEVRRSLDVLRAGGSVAAPGFARPEGIVVFHPQSLYRFKVTLDGDGHKEARPARGR